MHQPHVLVVENHPKLLRTLSFLLNIAGYDVSTATDGNEALSQLRSYTPDLILSGINLPGVSGFELTRLTHALMGPIPVVLLNPADDYDLMMRALDAGAADVVGGPYDMNDVLVSLRQALHAQAARELVPVEVRRAS
jgi:DNA-binding response OmpR family regulator